MNGLTTTSAIAKKIILVTGATDGIGLETAKALVAAGHHVLLHGRDDAKLRAVASSLMRKRDDDSTTSSTGTTTMVETYRADFSRLSEVDNMAKQIRANHPTSIDVLINNAGVLKPLNEHFGGTNTRTVDKLDVRFSVNAIAPYLLTKRLLPSLMKQQQSPPPVVAATSAAPVAADTTTTARTAAPTSLVINICSDYYAQKIVDPEALRGKKESAMSDLDAYAQSKLALIMWTNALADRYRNDNIAFVSLHPGSMLATKMVTQQGYFGRGGVQGNPVSIGCDAIVRAALQFGMADSGKYHDNDRRTYGITHPDASDLVQCRQIVDSIEQILQNKGIKLND
jgi:NAD(P)-dependent dehydrogenase (short-subunit alcohol dehydrogenase family)